MMTIYEVIQALRADNSKIAKQKVLEENRKNVFLAQYLKMVYEPRYSYYIAEVEQTSSTLEGAGSYEFDIGTLDMLLDKLNGREITGNAARQMLQTLWQQSTEEWRHLLVLLLARDIKCGCSTSTINKVWPNLISETPYMRCDLFTNVKEKDFFTEPAFSQLKADGMFVNVTRKGLQTEVTSRSGTVFPKLRTLDLVFLDIAHLDDVQLHGEFTVIDLATGKDAPREVGNGMLNSLAQGTEIDTALYKLNFTVWDMIPASAAVRKQKYNVPYKERFALLKQALSGSKDVVVVETEMVSNKAEAIAHYKKLLARKCEGSVLKKATGIWADGTSKDQVKLKLIESADLKIVGKRPGNGKHAATFGSLICQTQDGLLEVGVSGMKDEYRKWISDNWASVEGKVIPVLSNGIMPAGDKGVCSLFLPRLGGEVRTDKFVADTLQRVQDIFNNAAGLST